jgi:hypothetical protein
VVAQITALEEGKRKLYLDQEVPFTGSSGKLIVSQNVAGTKRLCPNTVES